MSWDEAESLDQELERYRIRYNFYKIIFGTAVVGLASVLVPGAVEFWQLIFDNRHKKVEIELAQISNHQDYVKEFLDTALNQDIELRIRFAGYFAHVAAPPFKEDWLAFHDALVRVRNKTRSEIHERESAIRVAMANDHPEIEEQIKIAQLERELEWRYREVGYVPKNRSVVRSKSEELEDPVVSPSAWPGRLLEFSAEEARAFLDNVEVVRDINAITLHHTWRPNIADYKGRSTIEGIHRYQTRELGWSDVAFHLAIAPDGVVWLGRDLNKNPASVAGHNVGQLMVELILDGDEELPTTEQATAAGLMLDYLLQRFQLKASEVFGPDRGFHRDYSAGKTCPGLKITKMMVMEWIEKARNL